MRQQGDRLAEMYALEKMHRSCQFLSKWQARHQRFRWSSNSRGFCCGLLAIRTNSGKSECGVRLGKPNPAGGEFMGHRPGNDWVKVEDASDKCERKQAYARRQRFPKQRQLDASLP